MQSEASNKLCVFGYGSLIWKPNFPYSKRSIGYITGYVRRFFQGNTLHRGTPNQPGRVATLVPTGEMDSRVWGCVYEVVGKTNIQVALDHLIEREVVNGGYKFDRVLFHPFAPESNCSSTRPVSLSKKQYNLESAFEVLLHLTDPEVDLYLGDASLDAQASQIASAHGVSGANSEYVLLIAAFMRTEVPIEQAQKDDPYLFELEARIREKLCNPVAIFASDQASPQSSTKKDTSQQTNSEVVERRRSSAREFAELHILRFRHFSVS
ncbi:Gamma-glutamylcyclotransferase [Paragonimus heterotremus]|uniref:glutathione-specific gamma-glutamylcyclotransferase n=1 Tax=Paragonimus heterotremus TaxID=100268 RepID=A0A8J4SYH2_9TREM|nr:Gamma-glutamylcyclotransferase [Paragonimus heterotremus]